MKIKIFAFVLCCLWVVSCSRGVATFDVVIIGGGTSGTAAGIQAARLGAKTLIVEEFEWLGGMLTSVGVSATDGNYKLRGGLWGEFRDSLEAHYGGADALKTGWVSNILFEPSVGSRILANIASREQNLEVWFNSAAEGFIRKEGVWEMRVLRSDRGKSVPVRARILIDATELGDIAAALGVKYDMGMDSRSVTGEDVAPEEANNIIQDLTYAMVLKDYGVDMIGNRPEGYDPDMFACCCDNSRCVSPKEPGRLWSCQMMINYGKLPNNKYMINWPIEGNDFYVNMVEMSPAERLKAVEEAKHFSLCFLYFLQTEAGFNTLALADDEFPTDDMLPFIPYHRESRRIDGLVRFTLNHIEKPYTQSQPLYRTAIGVGDYPVDQHHMRYPRWQELPDLYYHPVPSYGVPLGVMIPRGVEGLIVAEKSISVTNLVNGSTRLQPVVLQIGQAAGVLSALAVRYGVDVGEVGVRSVQREILAAGGYLLPYLDIANTDPRFGAMQRIGVTGIIRGEGMNVGWENQTWFHADRKVTVRELYEGTSELLGRGLPEVADLNAFATASFLADAVAYFTGAGSDSVLQKMAGSWSDLALRGYNPERPLTRIEAAVLIDYFINPFDRWEVDITGAIIDKIK